MIMLLFWVIVLGILAWAVSAIPMPPPFKTVAYAILVLFLVLAVFQVFFGYGPGLPLFR